MAWWWTSSESKAEPQQATPTSLPVRSASPPSSQSQTSESSFNEAFPHLAPTTTPSTTSSRPDPTTTTSPETSTSYDPSLPTTMSCRAAFDAAFYCSSFGGHFNDIYRYGQMRSCSEHWADWRFCMSLSSSSQEAKAKAIQQRYREKEEKVREKPNSENVWERRGSGEMLTGAFGRAEEEARRVEQS